MDLDAQRIVDLEMKFTFLEETLDALHQVALDQGRALDELAKRTARLERRLDSPDPSPPAPDDPSAPARSPAAE